MKRKIGELRNIPIVEGDKNLVREGTEIHINDLQSKGSSSGGSSKYAPRYFSIDFEKANDDWAKVMVMGGEFEPCKIASSYKCFEGHLCVITAYGYLETVNLDPYSFSYLPLYISSESLNNIGLNNVQGGYKSLEEIIDIINIIGSNPNFPINISMEGITEITEEEYYKID